MIKTLNIGILMQADDNWMGGIIYIKNLVKSIAELPANKREHIKLYLFIGSNLKKIYDEEKALYEKQSEELQKLNFETLFATYLKE